MTYSGSGNVTAPVQGVDLVLPPSPTPSSTSGCEASDFAGFTSGNIALIQRGTCTFQVKAELAQAAGASGVIIFNEGQPAWAPTTAGACWRHARAPPPRTSRSSAPPSPPARSWPPPGRP